MTNLGEDLRYAGRLLRKTPLWTFSAVSALAIGIALNTTMFSTADVLMFRPLSLPDSDRVVAVEGKTKGNPRSARPISPADFRTLREESRTLELVSATRAGEVALTNTGSGYPERLSAFRVSASFFDVVRQQPVAGRFFTSAEEADGRHRVAVISTPVWERRFGRDPQVIGRVVRLNDEPYQIIGVMPHSFRFPQTAEIWTPLLLTPQERQQSDKFFLRIVARLRPGATMEQAQAEAGSLAARLSKEFPETHGRLELRLESLNDHVSGDLTRQYTWVMVFAALFLLLICCANVANLQLARVLSRTREMAVRSALGAGSGRLFRQLLTENVLLASLGGLAAVGLAFWGIDLIKSSMPPEVEQFLPGWHRMAINGRVLGYTAAVALLAAMLAGMVPAWLLSRTSTNLHLRDSSRSSTAGRRRQSLRGLLVITQVGLALVLLAGASLMVKGFRSIVGLWPNVDAGQLLTFRVVLPPSRYGTDEALRQFHQKAIEGLRGLPGVEQASFAAYLPQAMRNMGAPLTVENRPHDPKIPRPPVQYQVADPEFFDVMRIPLKSGRGFNLQDRPGTPFVAIVSDALARQIFPGENPIGRRVTIGPDSPDRVWFTIVGVASDVLYEYTDRVPAPMMYVAAAQRPERAADYAIRIKGDPLSLVPDVRRVIESIDSTQPIFEVRTFLRLVEHGLSGIAHVAAFLVFMGVVALFLSILGIYSLVSYAVEERTREIGVRLALGATRRDILWMVLRRGVILVGVGIGIGLPLAWLVVSSLSSLVFGVSPVDWVAFGLVPFLLAAAAVMASFVPAHRATATEPTVALHHE